MRFDQLIHHNTYHFLRLCFIPFDTIHIWKSWVSLSATTKPWDAEFQRTYK